MKKAKSAEKHIKDTYANKLKVTTSSNLDKRVLINSLNMLEELRNKNLANIQPNIWRTIVKSRITKLAAAAVIIIAIVVGIHQFSGSIDGASVAWAALADRVEQIKTCVLELHMTITGGPKGKINQEVNIYVSSKYGFRADSYIDGKLAMMQYALPADKVLVSVMPEQKKYLRMLLTDEHLRNMRQQGNDPREMVRQFTSLEYTELGRSIIDGIEVEGIETKDPRYGGGMFENFTGCLWVDVKTSLPVRMEMEMQMEGPGGMMLNSMVMDGFEWDVELEPEIFEPNIPEDYSLMAEVKMPGMDEASAVQGLRAFAEITDGRYPDAMNVMKIIGEVAEAMKARFDMKGQRLDPNNEPNREQLQEMMEKTASIQGVCIFYAELVKDGKDPAYYGKTVTVEDADAVLMRWKISDNEYMVIYGDLTAENVTAERLAEFEAGLVK
jgi:hypothetical protein